MGGGFHSHNTTCSAIHKCAPQTFDQADPPPLRIISPLLIRTGAERVLVREADPRAAHVSQGGNPLAWDLSWDLCFVVSKGKREAGGLASLVQCSWIPGVTPSGKILGLAPCTKTHPPYIPGRSLANESFKACQRMWVSDSGTRDTRRGPLSGTEFFASC